MRWISWSLEGQGPPDGQHSPGLSPGQTSQLDHSALSHKLGQISGTATQLPREPSQECVYWPWLCQPAHFIDEETEAETGQMIFPGQVGIGMSGVLFSMLLWSVSRLRTPMGTKRAGCPLVSRREGAGKVTIREGEAGSVPSDWCPRLWNRSGRAVTSPPSPQKDQRLLACE